MVRMGRAPKGWSATANKLKEQQSSPPKRSSPTLQVGRISTNVVASMYAPLLVEMATKASEEYAAELLEYQKLKEEYEAKYGLIGKKEAESDEAKSESDEDVEEVELQPDGTTTTTTTTSSSTSDEIPPPPTPPPKSLYSTQSSLTDLQTLLRSISRSISGNGPWKARVNAAKFERVLNERYGRFRPFATHPKVEYWIKFLQRKHALGAFRLTRSGDPPLPLYTSVVLLFMLQRNKVRTDLWVLVAVFLLVGLQPWVVVLGVALGTQWLEGRRKGRPKYMKGVAKSGFVKDVMPYYYKEGKQEQQEEAQEEEYKHQCLLKPVGTPLSSIASTLLAKKTDSARNKDENHQSYNVIVWGQGPAPLYCAALLSRMGQSVLVLSPRHDASGCLSLSSSGAAIADKKTPSQKSSSSTWSQVPFDVSIGKLGRIQSQQRLLAPALCTPTDAMGGVRFVRIGTEADGYAHDVLTVPGMGTTSSGGSSSGKKDGAEDEEEEEEEIPFVLRAGGMDSLATDASLFLGDGWYTPPSSTSATTDVPALGGGGGNSSNATASYLTLCQAINNDASSYYMKQLFSDQALAWASLLSSSSDSSTSASTSGSKVGGTTAYGQTAVRYAGHFLKKALPHNPHVRSLASAIGLFSEDLPPRMASMAVHVSNVAAAAGTEGFGYPVGGWRSLACALEAVIVGNGGRVVTGVDVAELVFEDEEEEVGGAGGSKKKKAKTTTVSVEGGDKTTVRRGKHARGKGNASTTNSSASEKTKSAAASEVVGPRCIGVRLRSGDEILLQQNQGEVISFQGIIPTIMAIPDSIRAKGGVPSGVTSLAERRPFMHVLFCLKGNAQELGLPAADWWRLPSCALPKDEVDPITGVVKQGEVGEDYIEDAMTSTEEDGDEEKEKATGEEEEKSADVGDASAVSFDIPSSTSTTEAASPSTGVKRKRRKKKFQPNKSWIHVSFPSAKDPSWTQRHPERSICVATVEADDDFVTMVQDSHPKVALMKDFSHEAAERLVENVTKDVFKAFPQLEGKVICKEMHGPFRAGLSQNAAKFAVKGVRPKTTYPGLYMGGSDLTVDSIAGEMVGAWLAANAVVGYGVLDTVLLQKNVTTDLEQFVMDPEDGSSDVAVPFEMQHLPMTKEEVGGSLPENDVQVEKEEQKTEGEGDTDAAETSKEK